MTEHMVASQLGCQSPLAISAFLGLLDGMLAFFPSTVYHPQKQPGILD